MPLTWVRVPAGALQNGTHIKYASDASRFSVNRYQPRLFVAKRKKRLEALPPACALKVTQKDSNNKVNRDKKSATTKRVALFGFFFFAIRVSQ